MAQIPSMRDGAVTASLSSDKIAGMNAGRASWQNAPWLSTLDAPGGI
jgi:hypothetical protein